MKKILITAHSLEVGGIEKALINLLHRIDYNDYDVTLILEKKTGLFLPMVPKEVTVLEYRISTCPVTIIRKIQNRLKLIRWKKKLHQKYDFSCSFATYSIPGAHLALSASSNNALWLHGNYYVTYQENSALMKEFLDSVMIQKFHRLVFVSNENLRDVTNHYTELKEQSIVCNNFIDGDDMIKKSNEVCDIEKVITPTFVNIGRHDEYQKRLSRIIEASSKLKMEGYQFQILFIGDGPDSEKYKAMVREKQLTDTILFLGRKQNPYPYFKLADAVIMSSEYEGYPVVFLESQVMNRPIISSKVSDYEDLDGSYGIFKERTSEGIYYAMKEYLDHGFIIKEPFDYKKFNEVIEENIKNIIENKIGK